MSRQIPTDSPLTDKDRAYLLMRGEDAKVKWFDQTYPPQAEEPAEELEEDEDVMDDDFEDEYDTMTVSQLQAELKARELDTNGKKDALITRLREDDQDTSEE